MPTPALHARRLRQRSAIAEFALRALAEQDAVSVAEAACRAVKGGLEVDFVAVFERTRDRLELFAAAGWPDEDGPAGVRVAEPPSDVLHALGPATMTEFDAPGPVGKGVAVLAGTKRILIVADETPPGLDADDVRFFGDVAAVLKGAFRRVDTERALRDSEDRARTSEANVHAILDTTVDGILTIDTRGKILSFNPAAERIFGYRAADVVGENVTMLMPRGYADHHGEYLRAYLETGRRKIIGVGREVTGKRSDGSTFPMDLAVSEVVVGGVRRFTGIVRDITQRRKLEREVVQTIEDERRLLGQEIHDELGQQLSGIGMLARDLERRMTDEETEHALEVAEIADLLKATDAKTRAISRGLVLLEVAPAALNESLREMTKHASRLFGISATFECEGEPLPVSTSTATHVHRIAQEAFTNAARHAQPREIWVRLDWLEHGLRLEVSDDGTGMPGLDDAPTPIAPMRPDERRGMGVQTMIYRARLMGGMLDIRPSEHGGTSVVCTVPHEYATPDELALDMHARGRS